MARTRALDLAGAIVAGTCLLAGSAAVQAVRDTRFPSPPEAEATLYLTSGRVASRLVVEYQALAADLYWIRAIQHFGGTRRRLVDAGESGARGKGYDLLYPLLDLTTTLDPRFDIAYRFGATFLAEPWPGGPGRPDQAIDLLRKGLDARPDHWEYQRDIGFVYYWWIHDYAAAAAAFERASAMPGAPWWLRSLAATTLAQGGDRRSSRLMWETIHASAENEWLRHNAEHRLRQLTALDQIDGLQALADRAATRLGAPLSSWEPLMRLGLLKGLPVDPAGTLYDLLDGRVRLSELSPLFPLPDEPVRIGGTP